MNFQEVVHSVPTGEAEVVEASAIRGDRMNSHKNALLTPKGRESMVRAVVDDGLSPATAGLPGACAGHRIGIAPTDPA